MNSADYSIVPIEDVAEQQKPSATSTTGARAQMTQDSASKGASIFPERRRSFSELREMWSNLEVESLRPSSVKIARRFSDGDHENLKSLLRQNEKIQLLPSIAEVLTPSPAKVFATADVSPSLTDNAGAIFPLKTNKNRSFSFCREQSHVPKESWFNAASPGDEEILRSVAPQEIEKIPSIPKLPDAVVKVEKGRVSVKRRISMFECVSSGKAMDPVMRKEIRSVSDVTARLVKRRVDRFKSLPNGCVHGDSAETGWNSKKLLSMDDGGLNSDVGQDRQTVQSKTLETRIPPKFTTFDEIFNYYVTPEDMQNVDEDFERLFGGMEISETVDEDFERMFF